MRSHRTSLRWMQSPPFSGAISSPPSGDHELIDWKRSDFTMEDEREPFREQRLQQRPHPLGCQVARRPGVDGKAIGARPRQGRRAI